MARALAAWLAALTILIAGGAAAQTPGGVLIVDPERLFAETLYGQQVVADLERRAAALQSENREIEAGLSQEERDLTDLRPTMQVDAFRALADAFDAKVARLRVEQDGKANDLQQRRDAGRQGFFGMIGPILSEIVRERGGSVLVDRRSVILALDAVDITDAAIRRIDDRIGEGTDVPSSDGTASDAAAPGRGEARTDAPLTGSTGAPAGEPAASPSDAQVGRPLVTPGTD